jgi:hypothetical protein
VLTPSAGDHWGADPQRGRPQGSPPRIPTAPAPTGTMPLSQSTYPCRRVLAGILYMRADGGDGGRYIGGGRDEAAPTAEKPPWVVLPDYFGKVRYYA